MLDLQFEKLLEKQFLTPLTNRSKKPGFPSFDGVVTERVLPPYGFVGAASDDQTATAATIKETKIQMFRIIVGYLSCSFLRLRVNSKGLPRRGGRHNVRSWIV